MTGLRLFADTMHALIEAERRNARVEAAVDAYAAACAAIRETALPRGGDRIPADFHKANEGLCAVRIVRSAATERTAP